MRCRLVICWVALIALAQGCFGVQTWNQEPTYSEVNPGDSVVLNCKVYNKQGTCAWQKDNKPQGMFTGKYEWSGDRESGDCSIRIMDAGPMDNGAWECQVTASSFTADDALSSKIAEMAVRVAPTPPLIEVDNVQVNVRRNFTVKEDQPSTIKCISRYGNPAANIKWFLGSDELPSESYTQRNSSESDQPNMWQAESILRHKYLKEDHGKSLRCIAMHQAYPTKSKEVHVTIDVQYSPTVTLEGIPRGDVEEGVDSIALRCVVDANPPASIQWRRLGDVDVFSFKEMLEFNPVSRKHSATYTCESGNSVGTSDPISARIDVKYAPRILQVGPEPTMTTGLYNHTLLNCQAEGNPPPQYTWIQTVSDTGDQIDRGHNATLLLESVSYQHQGQYECVASNHIKGKEKQDISDAVRLEVVGKPQVLRHTVDGNIEVEKGENALIQIVFCSDPQPSRTFWEWGSLHLDAGNGRGRYTAQTLALKSHEDCYSARLRVQHTVLADARDYILVVENNQGTDRYSVALLVNEPVSMSTVIGIVITCLILLVLITFIILYAFKMDKCCFSRGRDFKPTDLESEVKRGDLWIQDSLGHDSEFLRTRVGVPEDHGLINTAWGYVLIPKTMLDKSDLEVKNGGNDTSNTNGNTKVLPCNEKQQQLH